MSVLFSNEGSTGRGEKVATSRQRRLGPAGTGLCAIALFSTCALAQVVREVKDFPAETFVGAAIDGPGSVVYTVSTSNQYGTNPQFREQIFRWDAATGAGAQLTNFEEGVESVSASDDGQWLAFISNGDLTGSNHDESGELFVMHPDGSGLTQLTNDVSLAGDGVTRAVISGSGNRIVFTADTDPLGANPGRTPEVLVVDRDGANLRQLTESISPIYLYGLELAISDDGSRVAFFIGRNIVPALQVFAVPADGSSPASIVATGASSYSAIAFSGNGETIVFQDLNTISKVSWDGTGSVTQLVASGSSPLISDDGQTVVYKNASSIWKIGIDGTGATLVAGNVLPWRYTPLALSGDGTRIAASTSDGVNTYDEKQLVAMDATGGSLHQLTSLSQASAAEGGLQILPNASRIYFLSNVDILGSNADRTYEVFTMSADGSGLAQVTAIPANVYVAQDYAVSDAGVVLFQSNGDLTGQNSCNAFQLYKINTSGTGLTQVTGCAGTPYRRYDGQILYNGQYVVYQGDDRVGTNTDGSPELFRVAANGTGLTPITADNDHQYKYPRLSASTGIQYVVYNSESNLDGQNPNQRAQIFRLPLFGTVSQRLTADPGFDSWSPDISGDGNKVVWWSQADFVGSNPGHLGQLFLWDATTGLKRQLTSPAAGEVYGGFRISRDGAWVYFASQGSLSRVSVATGAVQRVTGFGHRSSAVSSAAIDSGGNHVVFVARDVIDRSPSGGSVFMTDATATPKIVIGKTAPTLVTWDPEPDPIRYDVVRGNLASLAIAGSTVDLGTVACLEDDSPDNHTRGFEDAAQPAPGQGFFYLYRGTTGPAALTGSWGQGTGNLERVAGAGGCNP